MAKSFQPSGKCCHVAAICKAKSLAVVRKLSFLELFQSNVLRCKPIWPELTRKGKCGVDVVRNVLRHRIRRTVSRSKAKPVCPDQEDADKEENETDDDEGGRADVKQYGGIISTDAALDRVERAESEPV
ncbi:hypothetical protein K438DRAFT_1818028 [Mycena galopus ATCC 62051]|nr:hypothetical protein K438DRAFT_1818028 [Mycena galopus ATCC 62051]